MALKLQEILAWLDRELLTDSVPDYPGAVNGLQLDSYGDVPRVVAAVDASLPVMEKASSDGPGLLIVHHGMFWQGTQPLRGPFYRKIRLAMDSGLAVYSSHIPLDIHEKFGNNILLVNRIGLLDPEPFFEWKGVLLGIRGCWNDSRADLVSRVSKAVGGPVHLCPGGPELPKKIGIITGGAGSEVAKVAALGIDTLVTGEGPHWSYSLAEELGLNVLYAGHYATETFGVCALANELSSKFDLPSTFIDHPTGL